MFKGPEKCVSFKTGKSMDFPLKDLSSEGGSVKQQKTPMEEHFGWKNYTGLRSYDSFPTSDATLTQRNESLGVETWISATISSS